MAIVMHTTRPHSKFEISRKELAPLS